MHEEQREAHFEKDVELLLSRFAADFLMIAGGEVRRPTREESRRRFATYFGAVEFLEWDDVEPPIVRISEDGTLAHVIVQKRVRLTRRAAAGAAEEATRFAWLATYGKRDGGWWLTAVASTDRPEEQPPADGGRGMSLFYVPPGARAWKQVWVTERASALGGAKEKVRVDAETPGAVRFQGEIPLPAGGSYLDRTTLSENADGSVRQVIQISRDGGDPWETTFDARYVKTTRSQEERAAPAAPATIPQARPEDVESIDAIVAALYAVISGPAGERDWDRMRSLFGPGARLIPSATRPDGSGATSRVLTVDDYVRVAGGYFRANAFYESELSRVEESFGNVAHAFSTYASRHAPGDPEPFVTGINSIQLVRDGGRWWVTSIAWDEPRPDHPIPPKYLPRE